MLNKKMMLSVVALGLSFATMSSFAAHQGAYVGGQLGYGNVHQFKNDEAKAINDVPGWKASDKGLAGRLFGGFQFTPHLAAEMGLSTFSKATLKGTVTGSTIDFDVGPGSYTAHLKNELKINAVDLVAKGILPVSDKANLYGKLGVAYVMAHDDATVSVVSQDHPEINENTKVSDNENKLLPTFGIGATFDITDNLAADVSYTHIQKTGDTKLINNIDFAGVGLVYSFA